MRTLDLSRIIPALPVLAALAFAPAAFAQPSAAPSSGPMSGPAMADTAGNPAAVADPGADKAHRDHKTHKADKASKVGNTDKTHKADKKAGSKKGSGASGKKSAHSDHDGHDHSTSAKDTTVILGTPGSPTTQGVPGTGVEGGK